MFSLLQRDLQGSVNYWLHIILLIGIAFEKTPNIILNIIVKSTVPPSYFISYVVGCFVFFFNS